MKGKSPLSEGQMLWFKALKLPTFAAMFEQTARQAEQQSWSFEQNLSHLAESELEQQRRRRGQRNLKGSKLHAGKTPDALDLSKLPAQVRRQVPTLCEGGLGGAGRKPASLCIARPGQDPDQDQGGLTNGAGQSCQKRQGTTYHLWQGRCWQRPSRLAPVTGSVQFTCILVDAEEEGSSDQYLSTRIGLRRSPSPTLRMVRIGLDNGVHLKWTSFLGMIFINV